MSLKRSVVSPLNSAAKRQINHVLVTYRLMTSRIRMAPDFIIIGAQRCGTSSLYNSLTNHSGIARALKKEVHFFDLNFSKGADWYHSHFPIYFRKIAKNSISRYFITGEATPYYIFHPHVPKRLAELAPLTKLIVVLRNPVDRAYSHYHHEIRMGRETLSFEEALAAENERVLPEAIRMEEDEEYISFNHQHYSYLSRGIYIAQLKRWASFFPRTQMLILKSEDYYTDTPTVIGQVLEFLGLPFKHLVKKKKRGASRYDEMDYRVRKELIDYYEPHNQELYAYLGVDLGWEG